MRRWLEGWVRAGLSGAPAHERKYIALANQGSLLIAAVGVLAIANAAFNQGPEVVAMGVVQIAGVAMVPVLNARRAPFVARIYFPLFSIALLVWGVTIMGASSDIHFILLTVTSGSLLLFPWRQRAWSIGLATLALALMLAIDTRLLGLGSTSVLAPDALAATRVFNHTVLSAIVFAFTLYGHGIAEAAEHSLDQARDQADRLLLNVLPAPVAERLKVDPGPIADRFDEATVLFADLVHFTELSEKTPAPELVRLLDQVFTAFDRLADKHQLEKIKTIGDAYMLAAGVPRPREDHVEAVARMALDMIAAMEELARPPYQLLGLRIGMHTGPVVAGVIGQTKFSYDLWGDTVNIASRMESHGASGRIHVSAAVRDRLVGRFRFEPRGAIAIKGKGEMETYFLAR